MLWIRGSLGSAIITVVSLKLKKRKNQSSKGDNMKHVYLDIDYGRDLTANITESFKYWEFVSSETAMKNGIKNIPNEQEWQNIEFVVKTILQPLRDKLGIPLTVNSGFRNDELNKLAGGSKTSFHRLGCAVDVDTHRIPLVQVLEAAYDLPEWSEIIAEYFPQGWVHIAHKKGDNRKMLKLKDSKHHFAKVTLDYIQKLYS